ncbi:MAG: tetratricopeptide repeat protein [Candidatus Omnitrophica bacterium]|nr:tetratricopeptide repeat protein [Candidatus Omnitrophota bacterium]
MPRLSYNYLIFIAAGVALYFQSLFYDLTFLDDNLWVHEYYWYLKDIGNIPKILTSPDLITPIFYRPLLNLSFMLNAVWGGENPFTYHLFNIFVHVVSVCMIYGLFVRLGYLKRLAFIMSVIFLVHPVLTQAVIWIPGRTDTLLAMVTLLSFHCLLDYLNSSKCMALLLHILFLAMAFFIKETAVVIPVIGLAFLLLEKKKGLDKQGISSIKRFLPLILAWVGALIVLFSWRNHVLSHGKQAEISEMLMSLLHNLPSIIQYVGKVFLPVNLSVLPNMTDTSFVYGTGCAILLIFFIVRSRQSSSRRIIFGAIWFLGFLLPSLVLSFIKHEYRLYLPMIGMMIILMELDVTKMLVQKKIGYTAAIAAALLLAAVTWRYSGSYKDRYTFWRLAVEQSPNHPLAYRNLGAMYYLDGHYGQAEKYFQKTLEINPLEPMVHNNLGLIYKNRKQYASAEKEFKIEINLNPDYDTVYYNLGVMYLEQERFTEAIQAWNKTLELNPMNLSALKNTAIAYLRLNDLESARRYVKRLRSQGGDVPPSIMEFLF